MRVLQGGGHRQGGIATLNPRLIQVLGFLLTVGLSLATGPLMAAAPSLLQMDSRGLQPWIDQALQSDRSDEQDWAAHLLLFCAEPSRWLDEVRQGGWRERVPPQVLARVVQLNERAARLCQTVRPDQLQRLPQLAQRLVAGGHSVDGLRAQALTSEEREQLRERARLSPMAPSTSAFVKREDQRVHLLLWTLRLCAPTAAGEGSGWTQWWELLEVRRQRREFGFPPWVRDGRGPSGALRRIGPEVPLAMSLVERQRLEKDLLTHCPIGMDGS